MTDISADITADEFGLVEMAKALEPLLRAEAPKGEAAARLTETTMDALWDTGLMGLWVPRQYGGAELWPTDSLKVIEALCYADGSTGWVVMAAGVGSGTGTAYIPRSCADQLFGDHMSIIAGHGGAIYKLGIWGLGGIGHTGFVLGAGRHMLDELAELTRTDGKRPMVLPVQGGGENFEILYGDAGARYRAARALVFESWRAMGEILPEDGPFPIRALTLIRLSLVHITAVANDIASLAFVYGGCGALRTSPLQRYIRDMMAGAQHATTGPLILRQCAKDLMGMAEGKVWGVRALEDPV